MEDRLAPLIVLPPPIGAPWTCTSDASITMGSGDADRFDHETVQVPCQGGDPVKLGIPLFWNDPAWHQLSINEANLVACEVADYGVTVSALLRDLSDTESPMTFHDAPEPGDDSGNPNGETTRRSDRHRMIPYRPERYGLLSEDFDEASLIDLRLATQCDSHGRFAYEPEQIERWEQTPQGASFVDGRGVRAATFLPDVPSLEHLGSKIAQLRVLAPQAAVLVSIPPFRIDTDLPIVMKHQPDGVLLRCEDPAMDGFMLAMATRRARLWMNKLSGAQTPLWVSPGEITADDAAKLVKLGASAVAIDSWCNRVIEDVLSTLAQNTASRMGYSVANHPYIQKVISEVTQNHLDENIQRFAGRVDSLRRLESGKRLAARDTRWAKALGIPSIV